MGSLLLCAGKGMRYALPNAASWSPAVRWVLGQASDIERHAKDIIKMKRRLNEVYVKHTGQSYEVIERTLDRDYFMTADQAKEFHLIDKVLNSREEVTGPGPWPPPLPEAATPYGGRQAEGRTPDGALAPTGRRGHLL